MRTIKFNILQVSLEFVKHPAKRPSKPTYMAVFEKLNGCAMNASNQILEKMINHQSDIINYSLYDILDDHKGSFRTLMRLTIKKFQNSFREEHED